MEELQPNTEVKDERLWRIARKRAAFKKHFLSYFLVNAALWLIWIFSALNYCDFDSDSAFNYHFPFKFIYHFPWPMFVTIFWGIGIIVDFFGAYVGSHEDIAEREYKKLINKK